MPIGRPDWYNAGQSANIASMDDMGELAVRLGSPVNFDRTAKVMMYDDFHVLNALFAETGNGVGTSYHVVNTLWETGDASLAAAVNAGAANWIRLTRDFRTWLASRISLEVAFRITGAPDTVDLCILFYDGTDYYTGLIRYSNGMQDISYRNSAGGLTLIESHSMSLLGAVPFSVCKLDIDLSTGEYTRVRHNNLVYDLTGNAIGSAAGATFPRVSCYFQVDNLATGPISIWLDRWILSEDL